jgi:hypothetical protein
MPRGCNGLYTLRNGLVHPKKGLFMRFLAKKAFLRGRCPYSTVQSWDSDPQKTGQMVVLQNPLLELLVPLGWMWQGVIGGAATPPYRPLGGRSAATP